MSISPVREDPTYPYFPPRSSQGKWHGTAPDGKLPEVHLYDGSLCNRACEFCCVAGSPRGWYRPYCAESLALALAVVSPEGKIKLYGGEPTMHPENVLTAVSWLREHGFRGRFRMYSNGILATALTSILDRVPGMDAVLNYSILHGRGAPPIPDRALAHLLAYPAGRIFSGAPELVDVGSPEPLDPAIGASDFGARCPHCHPVVRSDGLLHGCPFAVEKLAPHFELGRPGDDPAAMIRRYEELVRWQSEVVEVEARKRGKSPCAVCDDHLAELPLPFSDK